MSKELNGRHTASLESHIGYWMRLVSNGVSQSFAQKLTTHGITVSGWVFLREVWESEVVSQSDVSDKMGMTRGAISKLVDHLVEKGLVIQTSVEADGRYRMVSLTPAGKKLVPVLAALADLNDEEYFGVLTQDQRFHLKSMLIEIARAKSLNSVPIG